MRICFIADARSAIACNWINYFIEKRHDVHVISSYRCAPRSLPGAAVYEMPFAFGGLVGSASPVARYSRARRVKALLRPMSDLSQARLRTWLAPVDLYRKAGQVRRLVERIDPDLVHAMRIPFEGMLTAIARPRFPMLLSCWGNDFEIWARSFPGRVLTKRAVRRADAFHCDCEKDLRLAREWGFPGERPALLAPGAGGIQSDIFFPGSSDRDSAASAAQWPEVPAAAPVVVNPRGARMYVRNDVFFRAAALVLDEIPEAFFLCPALAGDETSRNIIRRLGIEARVKLLPPLARADMAAVFRRAAVSVSPSACDGTPNTLLESMACGCFPIAGDIQSVREWICDGYNGSLYDTSDPVALSRAIVNALRSPDLRAAASGHNLALIRRRAEYKTVMARAAKFYIDVIESWPRRNGSAALARQ